MNKRKYQQPATDVVEVKTPVLLSYSVMGTDEPNIPAGAHEFDFLEDDDWDEIEDLDDI